ncbi:MAG: single-stranded-DNA-specific exonuclease RecJ [Clostridiaceae bacterium]|nr:single-stranded-DNA-specific exonuclease RecJ [Clostridiaceae bacterium]
MNKKWTTYNKSMDNLELLSKEFQLPEILVRAMINRGIDTVSKARAFLNTDLSTLYDPYLLKGTEQSVDRILRAARVKERVCVYGDYDVDGITSTAIMIKTLKELGADVVYYIPNRIEEGYGLSLNSIDKINEMGVSLIITVDCGIKSNEEVDYAHGLGIEIIITDHHKCEEELPKAFSIINPHQPGCSYPFKDLAGVGVAFKLIQALLIRIDRSPYAEELLDIVTIGTIADVVPLLNENRTIVKNGLLKIRNSNNQGIKALLTVCGLTNKELTTFSVAFMLAPRINAAGRISDAADCVELFLTDSEEKAMEIAGKLDFNNRMRQTIENQILNSAEVIVEETLDIDKDKVLVLCNENWHIGVIGIVASRLVDRFYLPAFIMTCEGEFSKGSARSIPGFNIFEAMSKYSYLFERYGGHEMAAGFTIRTDCIDELREKMNIEVESILGKEKLLSEIIVDYKLMPEDISLDTVKRMKLMEPFGTGNTIPLFVYRDLTVVSSKGVGIENKHLSLKVHDGVNEIKCIAFNFGNMQKTLQIGKKIDIICSIENNLWNGTESVQLNVKDIRFIN